jgi:hypothetical protein
MVCEVKNLPDPLALTLSVPRRCSGCAEAGYVTVKSGAFLKIVSFAKRLVSRKGDEHVEKNSIIAGMYILFRYIKHVHAA